MVGLLLRKHGGDAGRGLASISAGRSTREGLDALGDTDLTVSVARLGVGSGSTEPDAADRDTDADPTSERTTSFAAGGRISIGTTTVGGQRFRVLRPHARGGLGVVYVALDGELNREVALKEILDRHADDPISRTRFLLEAEITGGLEHPGIVPVYGLGTYGDGRPYYAMRFIKGDSSRRPSPPSTPTRRSGRPRQAGRWRFGSSCGGSSTSATRSIMPTAGGSCIATSSRAT